MESSSPAVLDAAHAEFISGGVSISAATCRPDGLPAMGRSVGCRVSPDRRTVTLFFAATPGATLLDAVRRTGAIAAVFSQPSTHRTLQLKGTDARIVSLEADDGARIARYMDAFVAETAPFGYPEALVRTLLVHAPEDVVALRFTPESAFSQTPGPNAGQALAGAA